jgi:hypothetical protein
MKMEKEFMVIFLDEVGFTVDTANEMLVQLDNLQNKIAFSELMDKGDFFIAAFDKDTATIPKEWSNMDSGPGGIRQVLIPGEILSEYETVDINAINKLSYARDWGLLVADKKLKDRLMGILPVIDIAGRDFFVDWRLKELRAKDNPVVRIDLKNMEMDASGENYGCLYDWDACQVYPFDPQITLLPKNVTGLEIPYELILDPVGVARQYSMSDVAMLSQYPIQEKLSAKVIPLSETLLPELVRENKQRLANQKAQIDRPKKTVKRHKGKKL